MHSTLSHAQHTVSCTAHRLTLSLPERVIVPRATAPSPATTSQARVPWCHQPAWVGYSSCHAHIVAISCLCTPPTTQSRPSSISRARESWGLWLLSHSLYSKRYEAWVVAGRRSRRSATTRAETQVLQWRVAPLPPLPPLLRSPGVQRVPVRAERTSACLCVQRVPVAPICVRCSSAAAIDRSPWQCRLCEHCVPAAGLRPAAHLRVEASGEWRSAERHSPPTSPIVEGLGKGPRGPVPNPQGAWVIEQGQSWVRVGSGYGWVGVRFLAFAHCTLHSALCATLQGCARTNYS